MWDGDFAGTIGCRWQPGTPELPSWCHGHIGYSVVPWKRRRGYATEALRLILLEARSIGLSYVDLTTSPPNIASQHVITKNGGVLLGNVTGDPRLGDEETLRYRIALGATC
jgi:predicted acetyltransferase